MKKVLKSNQEVAHYFANNVQSEGRASNFYFENGYLYSYGRHFCVARRLPSGVFVMTTRGYGMATSKHLSYTRSALSHKTVVHCHDPYQSAMQNMVEAQRQVYAALADAELPRIRQATRDAHKARALYIAEQANAYLVALPHEESAMCTMFDVRGLEELRATMLRVEEQKKKKAEDEKKALAKRQLEYLNDWRKDPTMATQGMGALPPALRLGASRGSYHTGGLLPDRGSEGKQVVQTSHGAEIPVADAIALWPMIQLCKRTNKEARHSVVRRLGVYTLNSIGADGSIVVGCHQIAYSELESIAKQLNLSLEN